MAPARNPARRARRVARFAKREYLLGRELRAYGGIRHAIVTRVKANLGVVEVSDVALRSVHDSAAAASAGVEALRASVAQGDGALARLDARLAASDSRLALHLQTVAAERWMSEVRPSSHTLVSVVMPTRDRADLIQRAIESVERQSHTSWELLIVDDGSSDDTPALLASLEDPRIRIVRRDAPAGSPAAARNLALDVARGSLIAYLDDDNLMHEHWLAALAWTFDSNPDVDVVYGGLVKESCAGLLPGEISGAPKLVLEPWDRRRLERENYIDMGALAHRAGLSEGRFDEELVAAADWDLVLRLTASRPARSIPVTACLYSTSAPDRQSDSPNAVRGLAAVRAKVLRARPPRVLAYNLIYPLVSETYIGEELAALTRHGAQLAYCRVLGSPAPVPVNEPVYTDLDHAVADFEPDVLFLHWATHARDSLHEIERLGLPFGLRVHSFDYDPALIATLRDHPQCIGVWTYPTLDVTGAHALAPLLTSADRLPPPASERRAVVSVSAGLPKKNWELLLTVFDQLRGIERRLVIGVTAGFEDVPTTLAHRISQMPDPPFLQVNLAREEVFWLLARTGVVLYTITPETRFGMPMSVVDAMAMGCSVILPNRADCRDFVGPGFRGYSNDADIVRHVREVLTGGPLVDAEREANRQEAMRRFGDPAHGRRFYDEVCAALAGWRGYSANGPLAAGRVDGQQLDAVHHENGQGIAV